MKKTLLLALVVLLSLLKFAHADTIPQNCIDTDGDLLPDQWEISFGLNPNDPADANNDADNDKFTNRDEFFAATNPTTYTNANSMTENQLLHLFQGKAFFYFWEQSRPNYYFTADKSSFNIPSDYSDNFNSIATTGFGLMAYVIADDHGWVNHALAYERIRILLSRAVELQGPAYDKIGVSANQQGNRHGYLYHFVDNNGFHCPNTEISTVDHALFVAGALVAGEYYKGTEVEQLARQLYLNTDWNWLYNGTFLYQGWTENASGTYEGGYTLDLWNRYSELTILLFLAMGNTDTSMSIPSSAWDALTYNTGRMFPFEYAHLSPGDAPENFAFVPNMPNTIEASGYTNSSGELHYLHAGSLHNHQYSHLFADFRERRDRWQTDFFANSVSATMSNRQFCIGLNSHAFGGDLSSTDQYLRQPYETYGENCWGLMAGIPSYTGYAVMQPIVMYWDNFSPDNIAVNTDGGTVLPSAPLGSTPFTPRQTIDFTRNMLVRYQANENGYSDLVNRYGFMNSFNFGRPYNSSQIGHFVAYIIGLDMGPVVGSIENYTSGLVWKMAMRNEFIQRGMQSAGFSTDAVEPYVLNFDDNPPLPSEDTNGGGQDPNSFDGRSYSFGDASIGYTWIDDPFPAFGYGPQQWAQQISTYGNVDSGGFILLNNHSVSCWDRLSLWVKGDTGTEEYSVGLKDSVSDGRYNYLQATEVKLPIAKYHPNGAITSQWTEVRIPLRDFAEQGVRLTSLDNISFTNTKSDGGTIYVDDIAFLNDEFKPSTPTGLATKINNTSVTLSWNASPEYDVVGYRIYRSDDEGTTFTPLNTLITVPTTYTDVNPTGRRHLYRVTAVDNAKWPNESDPSANASVFFNSAPILNSINAQSVNEGQLLQFQISATDPDGDAITYSASGLPQGATFTGQTFAWKPGYTQSGTYSVTFTASDGSVQVSGTITITVNNVVLIKAPTNLKASVISTAQILLTWTDNSTNEQGFRIEKSADGINFAPIATVTRNVRLYYVKNITLDRAYYFRVCAYSSISDSDYSNVVSVPAYIPAKPSLLSATAISSSQIKLVWADNSSNETGFGIERATSINGRYSLVGYAAANTTTKVIAGMRSKTKYYFRVYSYRGSYKSQYSDVVSAATL